MSLTWNPGNKLSPEQAWAHDLVEKLVWGRKVSRLASGQLWIEDREYIAKGLAKREVSACARPRSVMLDEERRAAYDAARYYYTAVAGEVLVLLDADDPAGAEALLVTTITEDLPARVAQHAANAELAAIA